MTAKAPILGWRIDRGDRERLLALVPPRYGETVADHVTHGRKDAAPPMPPVASARIVGRADDGEGVEALVVIMNGSSDRWDGSTYHITWSLGPGREARESNDVIAAHGWQRLGGLPEVGLTPEEWP